MVWGAGTVLKAGIATPPHWTDSLPSLTTLRLS